MSHAQQSIGIFIEAHAAERFALGEERVLHGAGGFGVGFGGGRGDGDAVDHRIVFFAERGTAEAFESSGFQTGDGKRGLVVAELTVLGSTQQGWSIFQIGVDRDVVRIGAFEERIDAQRGQRAAGILAEAEFDVAGIRLNL